MKRMLIGILALIMVLGVVGCSSKPTTEQATAGQTTTLPEPTGTEAPSSWEIDYYKDEFGDDTDDSYLLGTFSGQFSNTATSGSELLVAVYYAPDTGDMFSFRLLEYGNLKATYMKSDLINLSMKINDEIYGVELSGIAPNGDIALMPQYAYADKTLHSINGGTDRREVFHLFLEALRKRETVSCSITIGDIGNITSGVGGSKYVFKIDGNGFAEQEATAQNK